MAGLLNDISMAGLKGARVKSETPRTVYNNNPMGVSLRNAKGNVIPYEGLLGEQGEYEKSLPDTMGQFIDPAHGLRAGIRNLRMQAKSLGDKKSLYDLIERWHGKDQGKQKTTDYASMVAKSMGDSRNPKDIKIGDIDFNDSVIKGKMANAMISWEGGGGSLPQHIIDMAIDMEQPQKKDFTDYQMDVPSGGRDFWEYIPDAFQVSDWLQDRAPEWIDKARGFFSPSPQQPTPQQQYEAARMNRPPLTPPPQKQIAVKPPEAYQKQIAVKPPEAYMANRPQMQPSLQQVAQTAQVQPALNPFPWLKGVSGGYYGRGDPRNF